MKNQKPSIKETTLAIPTYLLGPEDKNPHFSHVIDKPVYPYSMLDEITTVKKSKNYRAIVMENSFIKLIILPDLGGRIYSIYDKTINQEVLYKNHVIKPSLIALRGAWISAGIEFNYFFFGHSVTTISPVDYAISSEDDKCTLTIGGVDKIYQMKWAVSITLYSDKSYIEIGIKLFNTSQFRYPNYFWTNVGLPATRDMQFICPTKEIMMSWCSGGIQYPVYESKDMSWYKNHEYAVDLYGSLSTEDYFGAYYHKNDYGLIHIAKHKDCPGKKFFTWGNNPQGHAWTKILTDHAGPYVEIQSGRFMTQHEQEFIRPFSTESWKEHWYVLKGLGGVSYANSKAAFNITAEKKGSDLKIKVKINTTSAVAGAILNVKSKGKIIYTFSADLKPEQVFMKNIAIPKNKTGKELILELIDSKGECLAEYKKEI
ncbi:MAG: hypothetical protein A2252_01925 [Elusimicrobia bacterium RIFOXYA2_FULL_39_19]|nr:MAG: hypothetical protein A2252_01925 [Elusimicrobia bacterium RIFOXYA2_FULL_39_19]